MEKQEQKGTSTVHIVAGTLLGITMLLLLHRYTGIDHDATLYLGQSLQQRWPEIYNNDLFFAHGSQGSYTLLPWLLGHVIGWINAPLLFLAGGMLGLLLFAAAGWYCVSALLPTSQRYWAWLGVLCLPTLYGRTIIFSYSEPFLTPRPLAEALCLLTVGLLARGRWVLAAGSLLGALACHPLQAIGASLTIWAWAVMQDRRWLHALWLTIPIALLGLTEIKPFSDLFRQIDAAWLTELRLSNGQLFLRGWPVSDYVIVAFDAFVLVQAWRVLDSRFGHWCAATLAGVALGFVATFVLVDGLHLVLPAQLQLWRVHWLAHWIAMAALAALLVRDVGAKEVSRAFCLSLTALLAWDSFGGWLWVPLALIYGYWPRLPTRVQPRVLRLLGALFVLGMLLIFVDHVAKELLGFRMARYRLDLYPLDWRILRFPVLALGLPVLALLAWNRLGQRGRLFVFAGFLCPLVVFAAIRWDTRSPSRLAFERNALHEGGFGKVLPKDAQVYWDSASLLGTWLVLQRADYYDPQQLSGMVFNRGTIFDARARLSRIGPLIEESRACQDPRRPEEERVGCSISDESMRGACEPGTGMRPDYLILPYQQSQTTMGRWTIDDPNVSDSAHTYWLYDCNDVTEDLQHSSSNPLRSGES